MTWTVLGIALLALVMWFSRRYNVPRTVTIGAIVLIGVVVFRSYAIDDTGNLNWVGSFTWIGAVVLCAVWRLWKD